MHSKRNESVVTAQYKIHERSSIEAAAWATQHQRNGISPTAPWRFVRDPVKLLLRSLCSRCALYALVAINALPRRLHNLWIAHPRRSWRFSCVSSALMLRSWRLNYAHDCHCTTADQGIKRPRFHCYRYYLLALKTLHNSRFSRFKMPTLPKRKAKSKTGPAQETTVTQPEPQEGASQAPVRQAPSPQAEPDRPLQNSKQKPPVCRQARTDPEPFGPLPPGLVLLILSGQSLVHNCQLHHSHWNYSVVHLVRRLVVNCCWTWISRRFI